MKNRLDIVLAEALFFYHNVMLFCSVCIVTVCRDLSACFSNVALCKNKKIKFAFIAVSRGLQAVSDLISIIKPP